MKMGTVQDRIVERKLLDGAPVTLTPCAVSLPASSGSTRVVLKSFRPSGNGSLSVPWMVSEPTSTSEILFSSSNCSNWLYGMVSTCVYWIHRYWISITPRKSRENIPGGELMFPLLRLL